MNDMPTRAAKLNLRILVPSALIMLFGAAEIVTSFTHRFFGLTTTEAALSTVLGAFIGCCYFASGLLFLMRRKNAAIVAIGLLIIDAVGRVVMVLTGLYPFDSGLQAFAIVFGTGIVVLFAIYIAFQMKHFA